MLLSVIVPVYNVEEYLKKCIESIIQQMYTELDIILVDDGSTDKSGKLCDEYAAIDERVVAIHKKNGGLISARKAGLKAAKGKYVTFVDGDDWIEADLYKHIINELEDECNICDVFCYGYKQDAGINYDIVVNSASDGTYIGESLHDEILSGIIFKENIRRGTIISSVWSKIFRKEIIDRNLWRMREDYALGEDFICTLSCMLDAECVMINNHICGYHYRYNNTSIVNSYDKLFYEHSLSLYSEIDRILEEKRCYSLREQSDRYKMYIMILGIINVLKRKNKFLFVKQYNYFMKLKRNEEIVNIVSAYDANQIPLDGKMEVIYNLLKKKQIVRMVLIGIIPYKCFK